MSAFAVVRQGKKVLAGIPVPGASWAKRWLFSWSTFSRSELRQEGKGMRLPSTYVLEGEHPQDAIGRVMKEQLEMPHYKVKGMRVLSYFVPSQLYPGKFHWDLPFVFEVNSTDPVKKLRWWKDLAYQGPGELKAEDFGWNSDFVVDIGVVKPFKGRRAATRS
jgi:hypothetical protein